MGKGGGGGAFIRDGATNGGNTVFKIIGLFLHALHLSSDNNKTKF